MQWLPIPCLLGCAAVIVVQSRTIRQLRNDNAELHNRLETPGPALTEPPRQEPKVDDEEVMRLRNEIQQLQAALQRVAPPPTLPLMQSNAPFPNKALDLANAAAAGDLTALEKLADLAVAARTEQNSVDAKAVRDAFAELGRKAGTNEMALQALFRSVRIKSVERNAIHALGLAAAAGNERALDPLVDPERYALRQSTTVSALEPAADAGNGRAIEALAHVISQDDARPLWYMAANALETAAANGSAVAINSLARLVMTDEKNAQRAAFLALERAALRQPLALETLQRLPRE